jgi:integrase
LTPHDLRRGLCGRLMREGVPVSMITALMRHKTQRMTENHYIAEHTAIELAGV